MKSLKISARSCCLEPVRRLAWRILLILSVSFVLVLVPEVVGLLSRPPALGNVAAEARVDSRSTMGIVRHALRGPMAPDGSPRNDDRAVLLGSQAGTIRLDLGSRIPIKAVLIQADHDDQYAVEVSPDAVTWYRIWTVSASKKRGGLRTRHRVFDEPVSARHLRIRSEGAYAEIAAIGAIRVYSEVPEGWPGSIDGSTAPAFTVFPWLSLHAVSVTKLSIALAAAILLVLLLMLDRLDAREQYKELARRLLVLTSLTAGLCWWDLFQLSPENYERTYHNYWDVYHYYMGSKYSPELRYTNLYQCYLAAEREDGFASAQARRRKTRDLRTNALVSTLRVIEESARCRDLFSSERWASFKHDHAWFRTKMPVGPWMLIPRDHGYNPSPAWAILGRPLASLGRASDLQFLLLISIDSFLFVLMWSFVWSSFGWRATCTALVFWGTNEVAGNWFTAGAFLRHDWLFLSVLGLCCLKRQRMALAGFCLAYAALLRVFPGFLLVGVLLKGLTEMFRGRACVVSKQHRRLALGSITGVILVLLLSFVSNGRGTVWGEFLQNSRKHVQMTELSNRIGLNAFLAHFDRPSIEYGDRVTIEKSHRSQRTSERRALAVVLAALFLPLLLVAVSREEDWVSAVLTIGWIPFVIDLLNYYYVILLIFGLLLVRKETISLGFSALTVICAGIGLVYGYYTSILFVWSSLVIVVFVAWVLLLFAWPVFAETLSARSH